MEAKPFSVGFRIEHPQGLIDRARLGKYAGHPKLGAADYKLVHHAKNGRSVYSFCMCPGGTVVAATSEPNRVVTNGMSQYSRNERNANAGIVVGITPEQDYPGGPLAGVELQERLESQAYLLGGSNLRSAGATGRRLYRRQALHRVGQCRAVLQAGDQTGRPGPGAAGLCHRGDPRSAASLRQADQRLRPADAVLTGIETRTSSPLRITRGADMQSLNVRGLYPAGEGAGYAGGILSAGRGWHSRG